MLYCTQLTSFPLLIDNVTLLYGMYPAGKVVIIWHLVTLGFPRDDHTVGKLNADAGSLCLIHRKQLYLAFFSQQLSLKLPRETCWLWNPIKAWSKKFCFSKKMMMMIYLSLLLQLKDWSCLLMSFRLQNFWLHICSLSFCEWARF